MPRIVSVWLPRWPILRFLAAQQMSLASWAMPRTPTTARYAFSGFLPGGATTETTGHPLPSTSCLMSDERRMVPGRIRGR